ncbi:hypothetical protein RhiirA1_538333 [Rhizophagus irregularis]|uniref:Uncharacterized protein n=2 Tax=Rhizophagus irregularis TaxID=588596 RepID=A0A2I1ESZ1_9GLOM|nr:hypothetical protein GLOIN_2v1767849 [Rhizophagus irregularis DAOM 181602=DAOM 197198]PKC62624.1 hypothetical protein RhiirA1_538333 [Rhizophagus irregularis]PKY25246.1 hypothetical protein RhiirB3_440106 [Rhizophagus irregularis]POG77297.1 hypothetical protein GLOIN_2v1767849 [Rhizophagus irregularis DAOM 181602=DAOM 197198]|eukprot:XP_025184163.1 hypothetical protein GLOIN_2v1767849 [Rhizophagus irregularis DAOM 181602=DAOM 197198]
MKEESIYPQKGTYPLGKQLCYTKKLKHPIPHNYVVKTKYEKADYVVNVQLNMWSQNLYLKFVLVQILQEFKEGSTTKISGSLLFGLKLSSVEKIRLSQHILNVVESEKENTFHKTDKIKLKQVTFQTCNDDVYSVNFGQLDKVKKTKRIEVVVKSLDKGHVSREAYRSIAKIKPNIPQNPDIIDNTIVINMLESVGKGGQ